MYLTKRDKLVLKLQENAQVTDYSVEDFSSKESKPVIVGRNKDYFDTRKYANIWNILKSQAVIEICILDPRQKSTVIRGVSQLKNLDTSWKYDSLENYHKRIKVTEVCENATAISSIILKLELVVSFKYRSKSL